MRYILAMLLAFVAGMMLVVEASRLAADGSVTAWVGVGVIGLIVFFLFIVMALVSVQAERDAKK